MKWNNINLCHHTQPSFQSPEKAFYSPQAALTAIYYSPFLFPLCCTGSIFPHVAQPSELSRGFMLCWHTVIDQHALTSTVPQVTAAGRHGVSELEYNTIVMHLTTMLERQLTIIVIIVNLPNNRLMVWCIKWQKWVTMPIKRFPEKQDNCFKMLLLSNQQLGWLVD